MRNAKILLLIIMFSLSGFTHAAENNLNLLKEFYEKNVRIQADFEQVSFDAEGKLVQKSAGVVAIQRPGLFRWDYREPYEQLIVADGKDLWVFDMDLDQVSVRNQNEVFGSSPASVLMEGFKVVEEQFHIKDKGHQNGYDVITLMPKKEDCEYKQIIIGFNKGQLAVRDISDKFGQKTQFLFSNVINNPMFNSEYFKFVPLKGVDIIGKASK